MGILVVVQVEVTDGLELGKIIIEQSFLFFRQNLFAVETNSGTVKYADKNRKI